MSQSKTDAAALVCHDCKRIAMAFSLDAILSERCESCQKERDEFYDYKIASENHCASVSRFEYHEHSTHHPHNGKE